MSMRRQRFDDSEAYFTSNGSGWMKLTKEAAQDVVKRLQSEGMAVSGIEAGIWHNPGFEARIDGILSENECSPHGITADESYAYFGGIESSYDTFIVTERSADRYVSH